MKCTIFLSILTFSTSYAYPASFRNNTRSTADEKLVKCIVENLPSNDLSLVDIKDFSCAAIMRNYAEQQKSNLKSRLEKLFGTRTLTKYDRECYIGKHIEENYERQLFELKVSDSAVHLSKDEKEKLKVKALRHLQLIEVIAATSCFRVADVAFNESSIWKYRSALGSKSQVNLEREKYCSRKFVTENKLYDDPHYVIELNPMNISTIELNCDEITVDIQNSFVNSFDFNSQQSNCIRWLFDEEKITERLMRMAFFEEFKQNEMRRLMERRRFYRVVHNAAVIIKNCLK